MGSRGCSPLVKSEDGAEFYFLSAKDEDGEMIARSVLDDRVFMHAAAVVKLLAAADITLEDLSDAELETSAVTKCLQEILKVKAEKEETGIGFFCLCTTVTLNRDLQIDGIRIVYDVAL